MPLGITQDDIFTDQRVGLFGQIFGQFELQDGLVCVRPAKETPLHAVKRAIGLRGERNARGGGGVRLIIELNFSLEPHFRIDFGHVGQLGQLLPRFFIQMPGRAFGNLIVVAAWSAKGAQVGARSYKNGIE